LRLSGSKLQLAQICSWFARDDAEWSSEPPGPSAETGTEVQRCITQRINWGLRTPDNELFQVWDEHFPDTTGWVSETAYALQPETGRVRFLGVDIGRKYEIADDEIGLSLDIEYIDGDTVVVRDVKTGRQRHLPQPSSSLQLGVGAYCAAKHRGLDKARVYYDLLSEDGVDSREATLNVWDLELIAIEVKRICRTFTEPNPGPHCRGMYCPAYRVSCPATIEAAAEVGLARITQITSPEHAGRLYCKVKAAEAMLATCKAAIDDYARSTPIPLGDGRQYCQVERSRESIEVTPQAEAILEDMLGTNVIEVKKTVTKKAITDATKLKASGKTRTALERDVMAELRRVGVVKSSIYTKLEEV
jgi:hypothetical protein